ncbi:efflux transporter outer membrane subunit [Legionella cardiaca]|uniref:Efflux transporter outer membrane subunit n=1 Tax=Legionella cardiaca TaxID=1071983 RepID=A0ABY8AQL6_9GAMM|nr:efflux transporter outer membrane subunit [Legionella cardiaca]WED42833.1 efflux transporter outer membrane subunit [Legionella cardiaca]
MTVLKRACSCCLTIAFLGLTHCAIGPTYQPPIASVPANWPQQSKPAKSGIHNETWWRNFHDPLLDELIEQEALQNLNLKIAHERVKKAQADYALATAQLFPKASINALPPTGTGENLNQLIGLSAALDPDFFGKLRQTRKSSEASWQAESAMSDFTLLNLQAEIASSYIELREAQARNQILQHNLAGNQQFLLFLKSRYKTGLNNYIDVAQQDALIATQLSEIELTKALIQILLHKLEILTGNPPGRLAKQLLAYKAIPQSTHKINLGVPSELLRRRADIIAAEKRVAAAHANIRVAMASLFPQFSLGWLFAWQTRTLTSNLLNITHPESTLFGTTNTTLFNLSLYRNIDVQKREKILVVIQYEMTVLNALHEVQNQYTYHVHYQASAKYLEHAVKQKQLVLKLARNRYQKGSSDFDTLLRAEEDLSRLEISHLHSIAIAQIAKVNLYRALGGDIITPKS